MVTVSFNPLGVMPSRVTAGNFTHWWSCLASGGCEFDPLVAESSLWWLSTTQWWLCAARDGCEFDSLVIVFSPWRLCV